MARAQPIPRYITVLSWPYTKDQQLSLAEDCLYSIVDVARHRPPPYGFDLLISSAKNIHGRVLLIIVELGYDGAPDSYDSRFFSPLGNWLLDNIGKKWDDRDVLHVVDSPLTEYFPGFSVWRSVHVGVPRPKPSQPQAFNVVICLFDPKTATDRSMRMYVGKGAQYSIIHREVLSAIAENIGRASTSEGSILGVSEGSLFDSDEESITGNLGVFRMHSGRSRLLHCVTPQRIEFLLSDASGRFGFDPYLLFLRLPSCLDWDFLWEQLSQKNPIAGLIAMWQCPDHYSSANNFVYLSRELLLNLSIFLDLHDRTYQWFGRDVRVEEAEMTRLGYRVMPEDQ